MPRAQYRDPTKKPVFVEIEPDRKEDFLDICHLLDLKQAPAFEEIVRYYKEKERVKPRPSRPRK